MSIFPSDDWLHAHSEDSGGRTVLRVRANSPSLVDQAVFGMLVVVTWPYEPDDQGLPRPIDREHMSNFEAAILAGTEQRNMGVLTSSLTGGGQKEWRYYAVNAEDFIQSLNRDLDQLTDYPLQIGYYNDPKWLGLHELQALVKSDA